MKSAMCNKNLFKHMKCWSEWKLPHVSPMLFIVAKDSLWPPIASSCSAEGSKENNQGEPSARSRFPQDNFIRGDNDPPRWVWPQRHHRKNSSPQAYLKSPFLPFFKGTISSTTA